MNTYTGDRQNSSALDKLKYNVISKSNHNSLWNLSSLYDIHVVIIYINTHP